jgi:hypothetical protein
MRICGSAPPDWSRPRPAGANRCGAAESVARWRCTTATAPALRRSSRRPVLKSTTQNPAASPVLRKSAVPSRPPVATRALATRPSARHSRATARDPRRACTCESTRASPRRSIRAATQAKSSCARERPETSLGSGRGGSVSSPRQSVTSRRPQRARRSLAPHDRRAHGDVATGRGSRSALDACAGPRARQKHRTEQPARAAPFRKCHSRCDESGTT